MAVRSTSDLDPRSDGLGAPGRFWPAALGALATLLLGALLLRLIFFGRTQSFDTLLYGRGLWGLARGDFFNPVLGVSIFALHAHILSLPLAPLTYLVPSAAVLALAQAAAFGATLTLVLRDALRVAASRWAIGLTVLVMSSPLVLNPFLFDPRPDLLGVPFLAAALLRAARRGGFDSRAVVLATLGALAREDFALVAAAALALAPPVATPDADLWRLRRRLAASSVLVTYCAAYYLAVRPWLGGNDLSLSLHLAGEAGASTSLLPAKLGLAAALLTTAGALPWLGWRWLGGALPGCLFLLGSRWQVEEQMRFHYGMLAAPGLIVAAAVGSRRLLALSGRGVAALATATVALTSYALWSSAPGGRNFARFNFEMAGDDGRLHLQRSPNTRAAHQALARIPRAHGVAVPWQLGAPLADRGFVWAMPTLLDQLTRTRRVPEAVDTIAMLGNDVVRAGRVLVLAHGFKLAGLPDGPVVLLTRDPRFQRVPWDVLSTRGKPTTCDRPEVWWPAAGLALCALAPVERPPRALVFRQHEARDDDARQGLHLFLKGSNAQRLDFWIAGGLVDLADLPVGHAVRLVGEVPLSDLAEPSRAVLLGARGTTITPAPPADGSMP